MCAREGAEDSGDIHGRGAKGAPALEPRVHVPWYHLPLQLEAHPMWHMGQDGKGTVPRSRFHWLRSSSSKEEGQRQNPRDPGVLTPSPVLMPTCPVSWTRRPSYARGEPDCASLAPPQSQPCQAQASVRLRGVWAREGREGRQH